MKWFGIFLSALLSLSLVSILPVGAVGEPSTYTISGINPGGEVSYFMKFYKELSDSGANLKIDGVCASGCTFFLQWFPDDRMCITARASLAVHEASSGDDPAPEFSKALYLLVYPEWFRKIIEAKGGLTPDVKIIWPREVADHIKLCPGEKYDDVDPDKLIAPDKQGAEQTLFTPPQPRGKELTSIRKLSAKTGIPKSTLHDRMQADKLADQQIKGRKHAELRDGIVLVGSDAHFWPSIRATAAFRAFVKFAKDLAPSIIVANGDVLDAATISRHPPIGWNKLPTVKEELEVCQERLGEIAEAAPEASRFWTLGNHDARWETRLAQVAPEFKDVHGISLADHFPDWQPCWSLHVNHDVVIKHRYKGGVHAPYNATVNAGMSIITGHLHSAKVTPFTDYNGTRYGVDTGCLAGVYDNAFQDYLEDNPRNWRSGFCVLTFVNGCLLLPELVLVFDDDHVQFRGEIISV